MRMAAADAAQKKPRLGTGYVGALGRAALPCDPMRSRRGVGRWRAVIQNEGSSMTQCVRLIGTVVLSLSLGGCALDPRPKIEASAEDLESSDRPAAVVRTRTLQWEGEQTYIPLYADGTASGLVVVNFSGGLLYGTATPDSWTWLHRDTVEICTNVEILRNEVGFQPMERDCAPHPITGKELDLDGDGNIDLIETFTILDSVFYKNRPPE
jgi:hypothetical protein